MPDVLQGKGVISGIAIGKVMLVSQNIDGYLAEYEPGDSESEIQKIRAAIQYVVADLENSVAILKEKESMIWKELSHLFHGLLCLQMEHQLMIFL